MTTAMLRMLDARLEAVRTTHAAMCQELEHVWTALDDIYACALRLENADPQLLEPLVAKLEKLWGQRPQA
jgi:hypothetical protein